QSRRLRLRGRLRGPVRHRHRALYRERRRELLRSGPRRRNAGADAARAEHQPDEDGTHRPRRPRAAPAVRETMNAPIERQGRSGESGFTLVETLVAIVVLVFGLMAV